MGLPYRGGHAGQLFVPADGYLYLTMGDGARKDDPYNFAQNKKSLLGKILRFDIDNIPSKFLWTKTFIAFLSHQLFGYLLVVLDAAYTKTYMYTSIFICLQLWFPKEDIYFYMISLENSKKIHKE